MKSSAKKSLGSNVVVDTERALEVLNEAGSDAMAVYLVIEAHSGPESLSWQDIVEICGFTVPQTKEALYRLGLCSLGVKNEETVTPLNRQVQQN